ncbi:homeobox protein HAT3.1-like [Cucurbita moschata]|uniref:Homeobox protein HAT3.1-like n=1 Tax=Cucurbita moschata TaxID=3662 RepID=A0A6J1E4I6_CUCMO|nr:homeobox protein HAT3.1-like [Cucurbita moschata]XP_022922819.1 homeobox protein HAT3.1-like [Cucurbita moschata]XP_022922820.1 homeobox protein HAT3.1-like [Cucurbita moschata]
MEERDEYTESRSNNNAEAVQEAKISVEAEMRTCLSNEQKHSVPDYHELEATPGYSNKTGGSDEEKPEVQQNMEEENRELGSGDVLIELSEKHNQTFSNLADNDQVEAGNLLCCDKDTENLIVPIEVETTTLLVDCSELPPEVVNKNYIEQMNPPNEKLTQNTPFQNLETVPSNSEQSDHKDKRILKSIKINSILRSLVSSDRNLRSKTQEKDKDPEPSNDLNNFTAEEGKGKKKERNIQGKGARVDEFSSIRNHLRYLLNRIKYEQNLIEAYSSEGWKGFSSDKLKPEKELQRASNEIMRRKLKIRDVFQRIDALCGEGGLSKSLFDSQGQIDSEDIFCAKCGSKELSFENDIILCDGICDRGFHQFCLEPPLLNTDIPPDDEGWLCPGCDCKDDCLNLLNEFQGSRLSITDGWEKVYPEAAASAAGRNFDHASGLPSDDSVDDDDYDPDVPDTIVQDDESSPETSGYASASEELESPPNVDQYLGLPSDDSEDDDYDPSAPERDEDVRQESSSSDFTSDSEDLAALDSNPSSKADNLVSPSLNNTTSMKNPDGRSSGGGPRKSALYNELSSLLESGPDKDGPEPVLGRRQVERLDYKKLHDETYGNVPTDSSDDTYASVSMDSSDDQGWDSNTRKRSPKTLVLALPNYRTNDDLTNIKTKHSSKRGTRQKAVAANMNKSVSKTPEDTGKASSSVRRTTPSSYRRLSRLALERLLASFQENQYPERATKESLAQELGLSVKQVSKWFTNTRWSTRHPSSVEGNKAKSSSRMGIHSSQASGELHQPEQEFGAQHQELPTADSVVAPCQSGDTGDVKLATQETKRSEFSATKSRKRKGRSDHAASCSKDSKESQRPPAKSPKVNEIQTAHSIKTRRRNSL